MNKILALFAMAISAFVFGATETVDGITWTYTVSNGNASVGEGYNSPAVPQSTTGEVTIPSTLGGKPVTSIADYAFRNCSGLTSVTIPDSVTSIGGAAFSGCSGLTSVTIPDSVTSIGDSAFSGCSSLTSVTIPDSVTSIGFSAFYGCGDSLFDMTTIPGVKLVDGWVVGNTGSLSGDLNLAGVRGMGNYAFSGCSGLTSVTIPDSVTSIGELAFYYCSGLTSVTIPNSVTSIGERAFEGCSGLTSVTIPDSVTSIEVCAFCRCSGLTSVAIPDSVTSIGSYAFYNCSGLTSVTMPDSVTSIGEEAFYGCSGLTSVTIPDSVTSIGDRAFSSCSNLIAISVGAGNASYMSVNGLLLTKDCKTLVSVPVGLTSVTIPDSVTSIGSYAFYNCSGLTSVTIPDSVTSIGYEAFYGCRGLTSVTIPDSVTSIGERAFYYCSGLTSVTIPDSVTSIGEEAFYGCSGLTSVTIPDSVTSIEVCAFCRCSGLTSVAFNGNAPTVGSWAFDGVADGCEAIVSRNSTGWGMAEGEMWNGLVLRYVVEPVVSDVVVAQHESRDGKVDITCTVDGIEGVDARLKFVVTAIIQGSTNELSHICLMRDGVECTDLTIQTNGEYRLVWDARANLGEAIYSDVVVRVALVDISGKVQLWEDGPYWAEKNIGADQPWDYGYYFWWGDTVGYERVDNAWVATDGSTSSFSFNGSNTPTDNKNENALRSEGWITADGVLASEHDSARLQLGGGWRMPTKQELSDLCNNCDWTWTTRNGMNGYIVCGRDEFAANSIFLPCAGFGDGTSRYNAGSRGYYWSSVPGAQDNDEWNDHAMVLRVVSGGYGTDDSYRNSGQSVRPVQEFADSSWMSVSCAVSSPFMLDTRAAPSGNTFNTAIDLCHYYGFSEGKGSYADFEWTYAELEDYSEHYHGSSGNLPWVFQFGADKHDNACIPVTGCGEEKVVPVITLGTATKEDGIVATVLTDAEFAAKLHIGEYEFEKDDDEYVYEDEEAKVNYEYPCSVWPDGELVEGRQWIMVSLKNVKIGENGFFTPKTFTVGIAGTNQKTPMITISPDDELPSATRFTPLSVFGFDVKMNGLSFPDANWIWCSFAPDFSLWEGVHNGDVDQIPYVYDYDDDEDARDFTVPVPSAGELYIKIDDMGKWDVQLEGLKFSGSAYGGSVRTVESVQSGYWIVVNAQSDGDLTIDLGDVEKLIVNGMWFRPSTVDETQCLATEAWYREEITVANDITMANYHGFVTGLGLVAFGDTASLVCYPNEGEELDHWEFLNCTAPAGATTNDTTLTFTVTESLYNAIGASEDPIKRVIVRPVFRKATTPIPTWTITIENGILTGVELNGATEVVIPDGVTGIGDNVFRYCRGLTSVTIPDSVTSIGSSAFAYCTGLTSITIPDSVTSIGSCAFAYCTGLTSITIPDSVTSIGSCAFEGCSGLTSVTIPDSVTSIESGVFSDCTGLTSVTIPDSVTSIGDCAFEDCSRLTRVDMSNFDIAFGIRCFERCPAYVGGVYRAAFGSNGSGASANEVVLTVTNVVVHYVTTSVPSTAVTPAEQTGLVNVIAEVTAGGPVAIASTWSEQYEGFADKFGDDFTAALTKPTGKRDGAGHAMLVWQDYVAGTDPTKDDDVFKASITFDKETGEPVISWTPKFDDPNEEERRIYRKFGKVKLNDKDWTELQDGDEDNYNFFKVTVEMR